MNSRRRVNSYVMRHGTNVTCGYRGSNERYAKTADGAIIALIITNVLLALLWVAILLSGTVTDVMSDYIKKRYLYVPPVLALLLSSPFLGPTIKVTIKWVAKLLLPNARKQTKLFRAVFDRIRKLARRRYLATGLVVVLVVLAGSQMWAVHDTCSPNPDSGPYGSQGIALSTDERLLYLVEENCVAVFSAEAATPKKGQGDPPPIGVAYRRFGAIPVGQSPQAFAIMPNGLYLYVANDGDAKKEKHGTVSVVDLEKNSVVKTLTVGYNPRWILSSPRGDRIYVSQPLDRSIIVIDAKQRAVVEEIKDVFQEGDNCPEGLALSPYGDKLYVASQCGKHKEDPLFVIDTSTYKKLAEIPGLAVGNAVALSRNGLRAYVTRANRHWDDPITGETGTPLSIVDTTTNTIIKTLILQTSSNQLAVTPDGRYVLVTNGYQVSVIDAQSGDLVNNLSLRGFGNAIAVRSDGLVIVSVSDARRVVTFPLRKALSVRPCSSI